MPKRKYKKFHKIKVHHNRWLVWSVAYVLFVAIAMAGYIKVSDLDFDAQIAENSLQSLHGYKDARLGFNVRYPTDWSIERGSDSSVTFFPSDISQDGVTVSALATSAEKSIRKDLTIVEETSMNLDSASGRKIVNDLGEGHYETVILAIHNHKLYVLRGSDNLVGRLLLTFHFVE